MTQEQFTEITEWQNKTFRKANVFSKLFHLIDEIKELFAACTCGTDEEVIDEFADCFLLLFGAASKFGMTYEDICQAIDEKMKINKQRKWGKPDANGVVNHIK